jgi:16S rRNA (guanine527-N7)-methyltransferase
MTFDDLMDNHVIDCLLPLKYFPKNIKAAADFGSGGGLPAVIYAIAFPDISYTAFEKSKLKQDFLKKCIAIAPNLKVEGEIPPKLVNIDLVTSRAFKPIDVILEFSRDYYKKGGKYFLLKARMEKVEEEMRDARKKFKEVKAEITPLKSPVLEVERHLVLI